LIRPTDKLRRTCGISGTAQADNLSTDYSMIVNSTAYTATFCALAKQLFIGMAGYDCTNVSNSNVTIAMISTRKLFDTVSTMSLNSGQLGGKDLTNF
jgi:hypothetical protein